MSHDQPWDPASEEPPTDGGASIGPRADGSEPGPSFQAPGWRPVQTHSGPTMPPSDRSGTGPDSQPTADYFGQGPFSQPTAQDPAGHQLVVPPPAQPPRRRRSRPVIIVVAVLSLLVLLVAADRVTAVVAGHRTASQIESSYGLDRTPEVRFGGFPFLTQLATSKFGQIDVELRDVPVRQQSGAFDLDELTATLHDVRTEADRIRVGSLQGNVLVGYRGVSGVVAREVTFAGTDGSGGRIQIELAGSIAVTAGLGVDTAQNKFQLRDVKLNAGGQTLPAGVIGPLVNQLMAPVSNLPDGLHPTRVDVTADGVRVHGTGEDLVFDR